MTDFDRIRDKVIQRAAEGLRAESPEERINRVIIDADQILRERLLIDSARRAATTGYVNRIASLEERRFELQKRCPHWATSIRPGGSAVGAVVCDLCGADLAKMAN